MPIIQPAPIIEPILQTLLNSLNYLKVYTLSITSFFSVLIFLFPRLLMVYLELAGLLAAAAALNLVTAAASFILLAGAASLNLLAGTAGLVQLEQIKFKSWLQPPPVYAQTQTEPPNPAQLLFADDFEHGLDKWDLGSGSWDTWEIAQDGWLEAEVPGLYSRSELVPADDYWQPEWLNYQLEFNFITETEADHNWVWGWEDVDNWYEIHFYRNVYNAARVSDGWALFNFDGIYWVKQDELYQVKIVFNQGRMQIWANEELVTDRQDYHYQDGDGGKIALKATTGAAYPTQVRFNDIRLYSLEPSLDTYLPVEQFKQYQQPWRDQEYNHAESWPSRESWPPEDQNRTTMHHWGCALTSLTSIFHYYDLHTLPDQTELDPGSFNQWLNRQADGYIGEGSLNWLAGVRLSRLIRDEFSTVEQPLPHLEYHRDFSPTTESVINTIDQNRPQILQIPGHFLIANGYPQDEDDLIISDPAYVHTRFSQHDTYMVSSIDFQPSQTDLSYLLAVYQPSVQLDYLDSSGQVLTDSFLAQDSVADQFYDYQSGNGPAGAAVQSAPVTHYLPKPETGSYQLRVLADDDLQLLHQVQLLAYDELAEVRIFDWFLPSLPQQLLADFTFDKSDLSQAGLSLAVQPDFNCLTDWLAENPALNPYLAVRVQEITVWAAQAEENKAKERYQQFILRFLHAYQAQLPPELMEAGLVCLYSQPD